MAQKPSIPKGTRDFGPEVMLRREYIFNTIRTVYRKYGFLPIETPSMEKLSVLTGKYGEEGDRLIFRILNSGDFLSKFKSEEALLEAKAKGPGHLAAQICEKALRYDLTVPFARFVVMHQHDLTFPFKRYQIQPVWRADRPQKGRYREFYQCDADVIGSDSLIYEAELIAILDEVISNLGIQDFSVLINNRKILYGYAEAVGRPEKFMTICIAIDKLDKIGKDGVTQELLKREVTEEEAQKVFDLISFEGTNEEKIAFLKEQFAGLETAMKGVEEMEEVLNIYQNFPSHLGKVDFNLQLARGLDYYTGTIFEVQAHNTGIGSIAGGGRYDDLTGVFGLQGMSGVGISFGADRIYDVMNVLNLFSEEQQTSTQVLLVNFGESTQTTALQVLGKLRAQGIATELYPSSAKMKKQFGYADKKGIPYTLIIGESEQETGVYKLKNMKTGEQTETSLESLMDKFRAS